MVLQSLRLYNFRNYSDISFQLHPQLTIIVGPNAKGKTNILEAIHTSLNTWGFRESKEDELLRWHTSEGYVETIQKKGAISYRFQVSLKKANPGVTKKLTIQKTKATSNEYLHTQTRCVLFAPQHIDIITGRPELRRTYIDSCIIHANPRYRSILRNYEHALRRRNKVLEHHAHQDTLEQELEFWNTYLQEQAHIITASRQEYCDKLNDNPHLEKRTYSIEYQKNEFTEDRCIESLPEEIKYRRTLIGPQKDDFIIYQENGEKQNLHIFGSRSEQRLGIFWLKYNEISYIQSTQRINPILLLDDVFSELDHVNKALVLQLVTKYQTILTTTDEEIPELATSEKSIIRL